jgi:DNA mismatch endonuclease (patch repair protein)
MLRDWNLVIFANGCFWHRHEECVRASTPKTTTDFWTRKFTENVLRDRSQAKELQKIGSPVATIWECQTFDQQGLESIIEALIKNTC